MKYFDNVFFNSRSIAPAAQDLFDTSLFIGAFVTSLVLYIRIFNQFKNNIVTSGTKQQSQIIREKRDQVLAQCFFLSTACWFVLWLPYHMNLHMVSRGGGLAGLLNYFGVISYAALVDVNRLPIALYYPLFVFHKEIFYVYSAVVPLIFVIVNKHFRK